MTARLDDERVRQFARRHVRHEGNRSNTTLPSEELQALADEVLHYRSLFTPETVRALEAGAAALDECRAIELPDCVRDQGQAHTYAATLRALRDALTKI